MIKNKKIKRVFHTWDKWECYRAGFYETGLSGVSKEEAEGKYADFLRDSDKFRAAIRQVFKEWPNSTEHYLTNENMNRVAWIGQASACISEGLPSCYRGGYFKLSPEERLQADNVALGELNHWLENKGYDPVDFEGAGVNVKANLY